MLYFHLLHVQPLDFRETKWSQLLCFLLLRNKVSLKLKTLHFDPTLRALTPQIIFSRALNGIFMESSNNTAVVLSIKI